MYGSSTRSISRRHVGGVVHLDLSPVRRLHAVGDVRRGDEQVEVELALEPLADDLHVQQPEEAAAEAEAERLRRLGLVERARRRSASASRARRGAPGSRPSRSGRARRRPSASRPCSRAAARRRVAPRDVSVSPTRSRLTSLRPVIDVADLARRRASRRRASSARRSRAPRPRSACPAPSPAAARASGRRRRRRGRRRRRRGTGRTRSRRSSARAGASGSPAGGGMRSTTASSTSCDALAGLGRDAQRRRPGSSPISSATSVADARRDRPAAGRSCSRPGRSRGRSRSRGRRSRRVCASTPWAASTTRSAPSQAWSERETS